MKSHFKCCSLIQLKDLRPFICGPRGRAQAVQVFLLLGIHCFVVFGKRRDTMSEAIRLEIQANSQILTALHPLEASSYLQAAVYCRDRLMHLPVLSAHPTFSSERSYIAEGGKTSLGRSTAWQRWVWEWRVHRGHCISLGERQTWILLLAPLLLDITSCLWASISLSVKWSQYLPCRVVIRIIY